MKTIFVLTGAGVSKESGLETFRDTGGVWHQYDVNEVCHVDTFEKNIVKVNEFHNIIRREVEKSQPNDAHKLIAQLEEKFDVTIFTQNIDDLHERAGSTKVYHLHGNIKEVKKIEQGTDAVVIPWGYNDVTDMRLRPNVVLFGETPFHMYEAYTDVQLADIVIVVGTSLTVFPVADLPKFRKETTPLYIVDPNLHKFAKDIYKEPITHIADIASSGMKTLYDELIKIAY